MILGRDFVSRLGHPCRPFRRPFRFLRHSCAPVVYVRKIIERTTHSEVFYECRMWSGVVVPAGELAESLPALRPLKEHDAMNVAKGLNMWNMVCVAP